MARLGDIFTISSGGTPDKRQAKYYENGTISGIENRRFKRKICFTYKFYNSPADYARMREVSDRLCREYAISVIENPGGRAKNYAEWQAEQNGKPTHRGTIRADIDRAILASTTERDFLQVMAGSITADMNRLFAAQEKAQKYSF